jgi:hypothetical protein
MLPKNFEKLGRAGIRIDHNIRIRNLNTKSVRREIFAILSCHVVVSMLSLV